MQFEILGPLRVTDGIPIRMAGQRQRTLLLALLAHANDVVGVWDLIDWLWPRRPPRSARATLHGYVSGVRQALEPERGPGQPPVRLLTHPTGYQLCVQPDELDALRFEHLLMLAKPTLAAPSLDGNGWDAQRAYQLTTEALRLWRGPALTDVAHIDAARGAITRLEELRLSAITVRMEAALALGRHLEVVPELTGLVAHHPLHERFSALLMIALTRCGRRGEALAVYRRATALLARELHVGPGQALREAQAEVRSNGSEGSVR